MKDAVAILPLSIFSGFIFTIPAYFVVTYIGPEVGSLLGALIGIVIFIPIVKSGFLVPKEVYRFQNDPVIQVTAKNKHETPLYLAWSPYIVIAIILVISRLPGLPIKAWMNDPAHTVWIRNLFGFEGIDWSWKAFHNPGLFPFLIIAAGYMFARGMKGAAVKKVFTKTAKQIQNAAVALLFGIALVQIMRYTNYSNPTGELEAMTTEVAKTLAAIFGGMYPLVSPLVGAFGALVAGSNTVSNIMFMSLQFEAALLVGLPTVMIAASQSIGGAIGNMVCIHNIVAITATTNAEGKESKLLVAATPPCIIYALMLSAAQFIYLAIGMAWVA